MLKELLNHGSLLRRVDAGCKMIGGNDLDTRSVLKCAELFQGFGGFERGGFPADVVFQKSPPVGVQADMAERFQNGSVAGKGIGEREKYRASPPSVQTTLTMFGS